MAEGQDSQVEDVAFSHLSPLANWAICLKLLAGESALEEALNEREWRLILELVLKRIHGTVFKLQLGVEQVRLAVRELLHINQRHVGLICLVVTHRLG